MLRGMKNLSWQTSQGSRIVRVGVVRSACYAVETGDGRRYLIDTAVPGERAAIEAQLERLGFKALDAILLTHAHGDHAGNAAAWSRRFGCPVYAPAGEVGQVRAGRCVLPAGATPLGAAVMAVQRRLHVCETFEPVPDVRPLPLGEGVFGPHLGVVATPGHTECSASIVVDGEAALVGDALIHRGRSVFPPFADRPEQVGDAWRVLLGTGAETFLCAHGGPVGRALLERSLAALERPGRLPPPKNPAPLCALSCVTPCGLSPCRHRRRHSPSKTRSRSKSNRPRGGAPPVS